MPPVMPEKTSFLPSGDQETVLTAPTLVGLMRRSMSLDPTFTMLISLSPSLYVMYASRWPSGDQLPAEYRKLSASNFVDRPGAASEPRSAPVAASASFSSTTA